MTEEPLTDQELGLIYAAGWRARGGSLGPPVRLCFTHSDGRAVSWTRDEVRAEIARFRAVLASLPALLAVADAARDVLESHDDASRAALWAALEALETPQ